MPFDGEAEVETTSYQRQLDAGLFRNQCPEMRPAGKSTTIFDDTATKDLQSEIYFPLPPTPPRERRFRKNLIPGEICEHYGLHNQTLPPPDFVFGIRGEKGESAERTFRAGQKFGIAKYRQDVAEQVYASNKHEPLGRPTHRGHSLGGIRPESPTFEGFGKFPARKREVQDGKEYIFPRGVKEDTPEVQAQYRVTHGHWKAGEQCNREYDWPAEAKHPNFKFGKSEDYEGSGEKGGTKSALTWALDAQGKIPVTRIGKTELADYRDVAHDKVGKVTNYMQGRPKVPVGHTFGKKSAGANLTAAACFAGYEEQYQRPDPDVGGHFNKPLPGHERRRYGVPSIRTDIIAPERRSIADMQNYGFDLGSGPLLNPQRFNNMGIADSEFLLRRPKDKLSKLWNATGHPPTAFEKLWPKALALFEDGYPLVSIDAMLFLYGKEVEGDVQKKFELETMPMIQKTVILSPMDV